MKVILQDANLPFTGAYVLHKNASRINLMPRDNGIVVIIQHKRFLFKKKQEDKSYFFEKELLSMIVEET